MGLMYAEELIYPLLEKTVFKRSCKFLFLTQKCARGAKCPFSHAKTDVTQYLLHIVFSETRRHIERNAVDIIWDYMKEEKVVSKEVTPLKSIKTRRRSVNNIYE